MKSKRVVSTPKILELPAVDPTGVSLIPVCCSASINRSLWSVNTVFDPLPPTCITTGDDVEVSAKVIVSRPDGPILCWSTYFNVFNSTNILINPIVNVQLIGYAPGNLNPTNLGLLLGGTSRQVPAANRAALDSTSRAK